MLDSAGFWVGIGLSLPTRADYDARLAPWPLGREGASALPTSHRPKAPLASCWQGTVPIAKPERGESTAERARASGSAIREAPARSRGSSRSEYDAATEKDALRWCHGAAADVAERDAPALTTTRTDCEPPCAERASRRRRRAAAVRRGGTVEPAPGATARRRRQRRRERHATATVPREAATEPTTTRRTRESPSATRAESASHHRKAAAERHAATGAAARPCQRQERQRGAAGRGAVGTARRRPPPERKRPRQRPHAESASRRTLRAPKERATATEERWPRVTPPRVRLHGHACARSASAAPQAAAPRTPSDGDRPQRGSDRAGDHTQRARAAERYARQKREPPPRKSGGRASHRRGCGSTIEPAACLVLRPWRPLAHTGGQSVRAPRRACRRDRR